MKLLSIQILLLQFPVNVSLSMVFVLSLRSIIADTYFLAEGSAILTCLTANNFDGWTINKKKKSSNVMWSSTTTPLYGNLKVEQFPCLSDNYGFLIHDVSTGQTAAIDVPESKAYKVKLKEHGWQLTHIFNTHHHWDHTGGNLDLKGENGNVSVFGSHVEQAKTPGITNLLKDGDVIEFGNSKAIVMEVGGHTLGHIAYYFPDEKKIFVGDCLFSLGCGRMMEGTPSQFWKSLTSLRALPDDTTVYCAHEYTAANAMFASSVEPGNVDLMNRIREVTEFRKLGQATVPTSLGTEKKTNPFLRCDFNEEIQQHIGVAAGDSDADIFGKLRRAKDNFRG